MELVEPIRNEIKQDEMDGQRERSQSPLWNVLGREFPRGEIVFFGQLFIITIVVIAAVYNLSVDCGDSTMWVTLLSACLGYVLPNPSIPKRN